MLRELRDAAITVIKKTKVGFVETKQKISSRARLQNEKQATGLRFPRARLCFRHDVPIAACAARRPRANHKPNGSNVLLMSARPFVGNILYYPAQEPRIVFEFLLGFVRTAELDEQRSESLVGRNEQRERT